jgi:hypothetical protein
MFIAAQCRKDVGRAVGSLRAFIEILNGSDQFLPSEMDRAAGQLIERAQPLIDALEGNDPFEIRKQLKEYLQHLDRQL